MKAYCIYLPESDYSRQAAKRCMESARSFDLSVDIWPGVGPEDAIQTMVLHGLKWTWANGNKAPAVCQVTGLKQHPYKTRDARMRIGCSMAHYLLWRKCVELGEPILILEHDAHFLRPLPLMPHVGGALMINDPRGATPRGESWASAIAKKGTGLHAKSVIFPDEEMVPDGLAGNSAYVIAPHAAAACMAGFKHLGVWPNDATLCRQIVGGLRECYPFVTEVRAEKSMAKGY
jgi:hypothetical protein